MKYSQMKKEKGRKKETIKYNKNKIKYKIKVK